MVVVLPVAEPAESITKFESDKISASLAFTEVRSMKTLFLSRSDSVSIDQCACGVRNG